MPRPKRTIAEVDTNTEPATAAKKPSTGRGKAKGKENEVPATKKAPVAKPAAKKPTATKAKKATSKKAKSAVTDLPVTQNAPTVGVPDNGEKADEKSAKATAAVKPNDENNEGIALPKSKKSNAPKGATEASTTTTAATSSKASSTAKDKNGRVSLDADGKTWICICRPASETAKEQDLDIDDEDALDTCGGGEKCLCFKPADDHPEHKWIVTKKGFELMNEWINQADKRCPDLFDMYIFEDFHGYGISEVIENMFLAFAKEQKKNTKNSLAMWSIMESMVLFFRNGDVMTWHMMDDSEGSNAKRIMLIGTALLTTIDVLIQQGHFTNDSSKIRNIGLILSMFLQFAEDERDIPTCNEDGWKAVVVEKADAHGVTIEGLVGIDELVQDIRDYANDSDTDEEELAERDRPAARRRLLAMTTNMTDCYQRGGEHHYMAMETCNCWRSWKQYNWVDELDAYRTKQAVKVWANGPDYATDIGGRFYDLTAKRNKGPHMERYTLGGEDSDCY